jgi:hypothetical protein
LIILTAPVAAINGDVIDIGLRLDYTCGASEAQLATINEQ